MGLKLIGEVALDGSGFERGLNKLGSAATHNFKNLVAGAFGVYSISEAIHRTVESADELVTASKRLDLTVEKLQVMRQAAKESAVEFGKLETALDKVNLARSKALGGDAAMIAAFARLGVSQDDLRNKTAGEIFTGPMAAAAKSTSAQDLTAAGSAIFGIRNFGMLLPVLKTDFEDLQAKMEKLGSIMSTETAVAVKLLADEFGMLSNILAAQVAPSLVWFADKLLWAVGQIQAFGSFWGGFIGSLKIPSFLDLFRPAKMREFADSVGTGFLQGGFEGMKALAANDQMRGAMRDKVKEMADSLLHPHAPDAVEEAIKKTPRSYQPSGDALVAVGNFLGSGGNAINNIAEQHLAVSRESLAVQKSQADTLDKIATNTAGTGNSLDDTDWPD